MIPIQLAKIYIQETFKFLYTPATITTYVLLEKQKGQKSEKIYINYRGGYNTPVVWDDA